MLAVGRPMLTWAWQTTREHDEVLLVAAEPQVAVQEHPGPEPACGVPMCTKSRVGRPGRAGGPAPDGRAWASLIVTRRRDLRGGVARRLGHEFTFCRKRGNLSPPNLVLASISAPMHNRP